MTRRRQTSWPPPSCPEGRNALKAFTRKSRRPRLRACSSARVAGSAKCGPCARGLPAPGRRAGEPSDRSRSGLEESGVGLRGKKQSGNRGHRAAARMSDPLLRHEAHRCEDPSAPGTRNRGPTAHAKIGAAAPALTFATGIGPYSHYPHAARVRWRARVPRASHTLEIHEKGAGGALADPFPVESRRLSISRSIR